MVIQSDTSQAELSSANPGGKGPGGFLEAGRCELSLQGRGAELGVGVTVASALGGCVEGVQLSVPRVSAGCFPVGSRPLRHSGGAVVVVGAACRSLGGMGCSCPLCVSPHIPSCLISMWLHQNMREDQAGQRGRAAMGLTRSRALQPPSAHTSCTSLCTSLCPEAEGPLPSDCAGAGSCLRR